MFKIGDAVKLKHGDGPPMTVEKTAADAQCLNGVVYCVWFDKEDILHRDRFSTHVLKKAQKPEE